MSKNKTNAKGNNTNSSPKTLSNGRYNMLQKLGEGTYGVVHKAFDTIEKKYVVNNNNIHKALKKIFFLPKIFSTL